jgi:PRTRC genetic system protein C
MPTREFVVDGRTFPDPDPSKSVDEVKHMMESFFPELNNAETIERTAGETKTYEFKRRVGTKG